MTRARAGQEKNIKNAVDGKKNAPICEWGINSVIVVGISPNIRE